MKKMTISEKLWMCMWISLGTMYVYGMVTYGMDSVKYDSWTFGSYEIDRVWTRTVIRYPNNEVLVQYNNGETKTFKLDDKTYKNTKIGTYLCLPQYQDRTTYQTVCLLLSVIMIFAAIIAFFIWILP